MLEEPAPAATAAAVLVSDGDLLGRSPRAQRDGTSRRFWSVVVAAGVLLGATGLLVPSVVHSLRTTANLNSAPIVSMANSYYGQVTCYRDAIERQVPKGARVYLGPVSSDEQLLVEATTTWASILPSRMGAQYQVSIVHGHGACNGTQVVVRRT